MIHSTGKTWYPHTEQSICPVQFLSFFQLIWSMHTDSWLPTTQNWGNQCTAIWTPDTI